MKTYTFEELGNLVKQHQIDCQDWASVDSKELRFNSREIVFPTGNGKIFGETDAFGILDDHAYGQVCRLFGAPPVDWMKRAIEDAPFIHDNLINSLAKRGGMNSRDDMRFMIRGKGDEIRAILSDQYTPFDSWDFLPMIEKACETLGAEALVARPSVGGWFRAYIMMPSIPFGRDPGGNTLHPTIYTATSEIGTGSVIVAGGAFELVCTNGLYRWSMDEEKMLRVRHRWINKPSMYALVAQAMANAFEMSEALTIAFIKSVDVPVEEVTLQPLVEKWTKKYGMSISTKENWLAAITNKAISHGRKEDIRAYDVISSLTELSQHDEYGDEQSQQMDRLAGDILEYFVPVDSVETFLLEE